MLKAFTLKNIVKRFPEFQLGPLELELEQGMVLGYVGPNGAGKTTTMQCLVGLLKPDEGEMEIFGMKNDMNNPKWKREVGYVGDYNPFYENWSGIKNLKFLSQFYPNWSDEIVINLEKRLEIPLQRKVKDLSTGNRMKLALIAALAHSPKLLILDEPTAGLDPVVRNEALDMLFEVLEDGERAILYSTHILSDISRLVDDLAFINNGKIFLRAPKDDLTDKWRRLSFRLNEEDIELPAVSYHIHEGKEHQAVTSDYEITMQYLSRMGATNIFESRMSIEEIAVYIMRQGKHLEIY